MKEKDFSTDKLLSDLIADKELYKVYELILKEGTNEEKLKKIIKVYKSTLKSKR